MAINKNDLVQFSNSWSKANLSLPPSMLELKVSHGTQSSETNSIKNFKIFLATLIFIYKVSLHCSG